MPRHSRLRAFTPALLLLATLLLFCTPSVALALDDSLPDNGIPVVYINIDETRGTVDDMISSPDHSVYCYGTLDIEVPEDFHYSDYPEVDLESLKGVELSIRGRGNSTWQRPGKKPFKIKLDKKTNLLGLGKNKHWALVANAYDPTLLRDRISGWLGDEMAFDYTPRGVPVDFVLVGNGDYGTHYLGSYLLAQTVRVDSNRLNIDELTEDDVDLPTISGGYLLQDNYQVAKDSKDNFTTKRGVGWATESPSFDTGGDNLRAKLNAALGAQTNELVDPLSMSDSDYAELGDAYDNPVQQAYIQNFMQKAEDALYAEDQSYLDYFDLEAAAKYWLVQSFTLNGDAYHTSSTYIYKKRDANGQVGKLFWGPNWDFDFAWDYLNKPIEQTTKGFVYEHDWVLPMLYDKSNGGFVREVQAQWPAMKATLEAMIADGGLIDNYYAETKQSAVVDYDLWHAANALAATDFDYEATVQHLKDWTRLRIAWFDENLSSLGEDVHKVKFLVGDETYALKYCPLGGKIDIFDMVPEVEGYYFRGWIDESGNPITGDDYVVEGDAVISANMVSAEDAIVARDITFRRNTAAVSYLPAITRYDVDYSVVPANADEKSIEWSSSNPDFRVDENGSVYYSGPGETVITAHLLKSGVSRQFAFKVVDGQAPYPTAISPERETLELEASAQDYITVLTEPQYALIHGFKYESANEEIATVDNFGIVTGVKPGTTTVHVTAFTNSYPDTFTWETDVTINVTEPKPEPEPEPKPEPNPEPEQSASPSANSQPSTQPQAAAAAQATASSTGEVSASVPSTGDNSAYATIVAVALGCGFAALVVALVKRQKKGE